MTENDDLIDKEIVQSKYKLLQVERELHKRLKTKASEEGKALKDYVSEKLWTALGGK